MTTAQQIAGFIAKFDPRMAKSIRATLRQLQFPRVRILQHAARIRLHRLPGSEFEGADPHGLLQGSGSQNRFLRLGGPATLKEPALRDLIRAAVHQGKVPLPASGKGETIIKSISAKQRPRK